MIKSAPQAIASARQIIPTIDQMMPLRCELYERLYEGLAHAQIEPGEPELAIYHNPEYTDVNIDMESAIAVSESALKNRAGRLRCTICPPRRCSPASCITALSATLQTRCSRCTVGCE